MHIHKGIDIEESKSILKNVYEKTLGSKRHKCYFDEKQYFVPEKETPPSQKLQTLTCTHNIFLLIFNPKILKLDLTSQPQKYFS